MKMRNCILAFFLALHIGYTVNAQCPLPAFTLPDSICANEPFQVTNNSGAGLSFNWDMNIGDLSKIPTGQNLGNPSLAFGHQVKPVIDNGQRYVFICNFLNNNLLRLDFGSSFNNTPTPYLYGSFAGTLSNPIGIDIQNDNGVWYAIIANSGNDKLVRVNLGAVISANVASATDLGLFGFDNPRNIKIVKEGANFHSFITNELGNDLVRVDFGNSLANAPSGSAAINNSNFVSGWGVDIAYDCSLDKYIGFVASYTQNKIQVLDFGTSVSNTPVIASTINTLPNPTGVQLAQDGTNWHLIASVFGVSKIQNFSFGSNLLATPNVIFADTAGGLKTPNSIGLIKDSSVYYSFYTNTSPATLTRVSWPENYLNTPPVSTSSSSFSVVSSGNGYQKIALTATDATGRSNTYTDSIYISSAPVGAFVNTPGCEGLDVTFTDSTFISGGSVVSWEWDFGDGSPIDLNQNPVHSFPGIGSYNITMITSSSAGCFDTLVTPFEINPNPTANFNFNSNQCQYAPVLFNDNSMITGTSIIDTWLWDFGDSTAIDSSQNPLHSFQNSGPFDVLLTVYTDAGCTDTVSFQININPTPESEFTVNSTCVGDIVNFINTSTITGGTNLDFEWDFGDTNISVAPSPSHQYPAGTGNYDVTLISTSVDGCKDTLVQNVNISNQPVPLFDWTPIVVCQGNEVFFNNSSMGINGDTISAYIWDFGDLQTSDLENPTHIYADTGMYNITLTAISPTYCDSSITLQINVIPGPEVSFNTSNVCLNEATLFNLTANTPPGTVVDSIVWDFGDGNFFSGLISPSHSYAAPGTYIVTATVYNDVLCTGTFIDSVEVYPLPVADFSTSLACTGTETNFDGTLSTVSSGSITSWLWNFDGMGTSNDSITQFTFNTPGVFNITLISISNNGCSDTTVKQITSTQAPDFTFIFNEPCYGDATTFTYVSNIIPVPPSNLTWQFGDSTLSSLLSPSHIYSSSDSFTVTLTVVNPVTGCSATEMNQIYIKPLPEPGFIIDNDCEGQLIDVIDTTSIAAGSINSWSWNFGSLGTSSDPNPQLQPGTAGIYPVQLNVISDAGCNATATGSFEVYARPEAAFTPSPNFGSPPATINFINNTNGAVAYSWNFGDGQSGTGFNPTHLYSDTGVYAVTMIASSIEGCLDTSTATVSVLIPYLDIAVSNIFATITDGKMKLIAQLTNMGNLIITETNLKGSIENGTIINENWTGMLMPGASTYYNFTSSFEISDSYRLTYYCIEAENPNNDIDQNLTNNKKCAVLINEFEIFNAYPSPFSDELNVNINLNSEGSYEATMYDETGKLVTKKLINNGKKGFNTFSFNTYGYSNGYYTIVVRFRDQQKSIKALKTGKK